MKIFGVVLCSFLMSPLMAQAGDSSSSVYTIAILVILAALIFVSAVVAVSENLLSIERDKAGVKIRKPKSGWAAIKSLWSYDDVSYVGEGDLVTLEKGYDIKLKGIPAKEIEEIQVNRYAVRPPNYRGIAPIPKMQVKEGDEVKAGEVLFHDKKEDRIKFVAPVSGEVVEIRRGAKRAITEVIILADREIEYVQHEAPSLEHVSREDLTAYLLATGGWALFNQRPYDVLATPYDVPDNIFISTFDTAPLAPDYNLIIEGKGDIFQAGLDALNILTDGTVFLGLDANGMTAPNKAFTDASGVEKTWFKGPHPSGNVGVQIHHTAPIKPGMKVWTLTVQDVLTLGSLVHKGIYDATRYVAVGGAKVSEPKHLKTYIGASADELLKFRFDEDKARVIAGDVLTGRKLGEDEFLDHGTDQVTVIEEGDYYEMFGWLLPLAARPTISKTFPNFLYPNMKFEGDTNTHGEKRAFVVTGEYEKVLPMNIYPQHLAKAIMAGDFEQMEGLGIYELTEEDIALCEFVCTSKTPLQSTLRDGLEMLREQG